MTDTRGYTCMKTSSIIRGVTAWVWSKYRIETGSILSIWADIDRYRIESILASIAHHYSRVNYQFPATRYYRNPVEVGITFASLTYQASLKLNFCGFTTFLSKCVGGRLAIVAI